jgi:hypothetical protein
VENCAVQMEGETINKNLPKIIKEMEKYWKP